VRKPTKRKSAIKDNQCVRISVDLSPKDFKRLELLQSLSETDMVNTIRQAIRRNARLAYEVRAGKRIFIGEDRETSGEVILFWSHDGG
jgi:hypothetical protein